MRTFLRKLAFSTINEEKLGHRVLSHQWQNFKDIWHNRLNPSSNAIGTERVLKMLLILSQFCFPGIYIRALFGSYGKLHKHIGVELHVIFKLILSAVILHFGLYQNDIFIVFGLNLIKLWCYWMILETVFYIGNLLISEDVFAKPHSHKRNLILIIIDYITINLDFATIYLISEGLKTTIQKDTHSIEVIVTNTRDAIYFTFISSMTIGYGDISPINFGRNIAVFHSLIILLFGVLFINFYLSRLNSR
jgi:hypothetical protein